MCVAVQNAAPTCTSQGDLQSVKLHYKQVLFRLNILTKLGDAEAAPEAVHRAGGRLCPTCSSLSVPSFLRGPTFSGRASGWVMKSDGITKKEREQYVPVLSCPVPLLSRLTFAVTGGFLNGWIRRLRLMFSCLASN